MNIIEEGDKVTIKVEAKLESGEHCFPKNKESSIELVVGEGKFFPVLENRLIKMKEGGTKEITLEPNDAFGPHNNELVMDAPRSVFRPDDKLAIGMRLKIDSPSGKVYYGTITEITNEAITIDLNHPLAGKTLIYELEIKEKIEKTEDKIKMIINLYTRIEKEKVDIKINDKDVEIVLPPLINPIYKKKIADECIKFLDLEKIK